MTPKHALVLTLSKRGSTAVSIVVFASVLLCALVFVWPFGGGPATPAAIKRRWWHPQPWTRQMLEVDATKHWSKMTQETEGQVPRLESGDVEFPESRILELVMQSNRTFRPCTQWNAIRLREAYINILPNLHDTSKDFSIEQEQLRRRRALRDACRGEEIKRPYMRMKRAERKVLLNHLLVDDKRNTIYCYVPKVGCANWKKVFKVMRGHDAWPGCLPFSHVTAAVPLSSYSKKQKIYRLKHYYKFMFVRDPLARLVSAYIDKFTSSHTAQMYYDYYKKHFTRLVSAHKFHPNATDRSFNSSHDEHIVRNFRSPKPRNDTGASSHHVTWKEFVEFVISLKQNDAYFNEHWDNYDNLCQPCLIDYDFVGHYEQMTDEANYVLRQVKAHDLVAYPQRQGFYHTSSRDRVTSLFRTLNASTQQRILDVYATSYRLFGYQRPTVDKATT